MPCNAMRKPHKHTAPAVMAADTMPGSRADAGSPLRSAWISPSGRPRRCPGSEAWRPPAMALRCCARDECLPLQRGDELLFSPPRLACRHVAACRAAAAAVGGRSRGEQRWGERLGARRLGAGAAAAQVTRVCAARCHQLLGDLKGLPGGKGPFCLAIHGRSVRVGFKNGSWIQGFNGVAGPWALVLSLAEEMRNLAALCTARGLLSTG